MRVGGAFREFSRRRYLRRPPPFAVPRNRGSLSAFWGIWGARLLPDNCVAKLVFADVYSQRMFWRRSMWMRTRMTKMILLHVLHSAKRKRKAEEKSGRRREKRGKFKAKWGRQTPNGVGTKAGSRSKCHQRVSEYCRSATRPLKDMLRSHFASLPPYSSKGKC